MSLAGEWGVERKKKLFNIRDSENRFMTVYQGSFNNIGERMDQEKKNQEGKNMHASGMEYTKYSIAANEDIAAENETNRPVEAFKRTFPKMYNSMDSPIAVGRSGLRKEKGVSTSGLLGERLMQSDDPKWNSAAQRCWLYNDDPALRFKQTGIPKAEIPNDVSLNVGENSEPFKGWNYGRKAILTGDLHTRTGYTRADPENPVAKVNATAFAVSALRYLETEEENGICKDPYAGVLCGGKGMAWFQRYSKEKPERAAYLRDLLLIRTKFIDICMERSFSELAEFQICILGSGLDCRAFRLHPPSGKKPRFFEVDYPGVIDYKMKILNRERAVSEFEHILVRTDLSKEGWVTELINAGFDRTIPTVWLLEGFTMYLDEESITTLFHLLTNDLSAPESILIADFIGPFFGIESAFADLFKFQPGNPTEFLNKFGLET